MRSLVLGLVLAFAGCATAPPVGPPAVGAPDLRGSWTGTWGGEPLALLVTEQTIGPGESGLVLGPWQVLGERYPTVTGVLTSTIRGERVSTHANGLKSRGAVTPPHGLPAAPSSDTKSAGGGSG